MRIEADLDLCQGHATCEAEAPDVFSVPKRGKVTVLMDQVPETLRPQVELAVTYCPTHAITIRED